MPFTQSQPTTARPILEAVKIINLSARRSADVTYMVLPPAAEAPSDKRTERRWRTHLRSGKIIDKHACIVTESQVRDRSARGVRLRLTVNIQLPKRIRFIDDVGKRMFEAAVAWQRGRDIGVSLLREVDPRELTRAELFKLGLKMK